MGLTIGNENLRAPEGPSEGPSESLSRPESRDDWLPDCSNAPALCMILLLLEFMDSIVSSASDSELRLSTTAGAATIPVDKEPPESRSTDRMVTVLRVFGINRARALELRGHVWPQVMSLNRDSARYCALVSNDALLSLRGWLRGDALGAYFSLVARASGGTCVAMDDNLTDYMTGGQYCAQRDVLTALAAANISPAKSSVQCTSLHTGLVPLSSPSIQHHRVTGMVLQLGMRGY